MPSDQGGSYYDYRDQITRLRRMYYEGLIDYQRTLELSFQMDEEYIKYLEWQLNDFCEKPGKYIDKNEGPAASKMDQAQEEALLITTESSMASYQKKQARRGQTRR